MKQKLMLLAAGVLATLAFSALPSVAAAGEFVADCGSGATCGGTVESTGITTLGTAHLAVECKATGGTTSQTTTSSTGAVQLLFTGCEDEITNGSCKNTTTAGNITTNSMVSHLIYLEKEPKKVGVLLTGANVTFECFGGLVKQTVTGSIIGEIENPECGVARAHHTITFEQTSKGQQKWKQSETVGTAFDLTDNNDAGGAYETASQVGTAHINYTGGNTVKLTC